MPDGARFQFFLTSLRFVRKKWNLVYLSLHNLLDIPRKVFLICDNLRVHHAYIFRDWLAERTDRIEVFYLPSYSPEYNPDEYLNNDLKRNIALKPQARDVGDIQKYTEEFMTGLSGNPDHVKSYFDHEKLNSYKD